MFETFQTVLGTVLTEPRRLTTAGGDLLSFRVGSTVRYREPATGQWRDGVRLYLTVNCWRRLAGAVGAAIEKGSAVICHGQVFTAEYTARDGTARTDLEMRALAVGLDLGRAAALAAAAARRADPDSAEPGRAEEGRAEETNFAAADGRGDEGDRVDSGAGRQAARPLVPTADRPGPEPAVT